MTPLDSDLIYIKNLANDSDTPTNPPLTDPLGMELLQLNLDGSTPTYTHIPLCVLYPMVESETSLPSALEVLATMKSLPPLSVAILTPLSTPLISS